MLIFSLLLACAGDIFIDPDMGPCTNWDLQVRDTPELTVTQEGDSLVIVRNGIFRGCSAVFDPSFDPEPRVLRVYEDWLDDDGDDCQCIKAEVVLTPAKRGTWDIQWYEDAADLNPVNRVEIEVE